MRQSIKLICNFSKSSSTQKVFFLTIQINSHEIHFHNISYILLSSFISIEEARLVVLPYSPCRNLVDFNTKRIAFIFVFATEMYALDLDIDVIEQTQK